MCIWCDAAACTTAKCAATQCLGRQNTTLEATTCPARQVRERGASYLLEDRERLLPERDRLLRDRERLLPLRERERSPPRGLGDRPPSSTLAAASFSSSCATFTRKVLTQ